MVARAQRQPVKIHTSFVSIVWLRRDGPTTPAWLLLLMGLAAGLFLFLPIAVVIAGRCSR
jgi:hypothetical protein